MKIFLILLLWSLVAGCNGGKTEIKSDQKDRLVTMRSNMVEYQIEARGVKDARVLQAMRSVPRHVFVPANLQENAYNDEPLPIGLGQTISQPYIVAFMTEQLKLQAKDRVLEIGTGSGYQAAILAELVDTVYTIEILPDLSEKAQEVIRQLGYGNIKFRIGNGYFGWPEEAPFDAIMVTAAPEEIPEPLLQQLKIGGRMIIPVGGYFQELYLIIRDKDGIKKQKKLPVRFVPLQGEP